MKPKHIYLILLSVGLIEILLFLIIGKNSPASLWESMMSFALGEEYSLPAFVQGMIAVFLLLASVSYLLFAPKENAASEERLQMPGLLEEIDYAEKEEEIKPLAENKELTKESPKLTDIDPELKPPNNKKDNSPMFDIPPPGAPTKRPPDSKRKLL